MIPAYYGAGVPFDTAFNGQPAPVGLAMGAGPYGTYPHGLSKASANKYTQPTPWMHGPNASAHPGAWPGHPGLATGAPYPYPVPLPSSGGSYGALGREYGAAGLPHPAEHHGYRPTGRGHWGFNAPQY